MSDKKPAILPFPAVQRFCPVCGKISYSLSGEHPQCSVARGDTVLRARQKKQNQRKHALAPKPLDKAHR